MNIFKILIDKILIVLYSLMATTSKRHGYHVKKTWLPRQKDMATTSKRIVFNLIKLSIQNATNAADKDDKIIKSCITKCLKKHLHRAYKKRKRKSRGSFG